MYDISSLRVKVLMPTNPKRLSLYDVVISTAITVNTMARRQQGEFRE